MLLRNAPIGLARPHIEKLILYTPFLSPGDLSIDPTPVIADMELSEPRDLTWAIRPDSGI
jgi:hypothetical protein